LREIAAKATLSTARIINMTTPQPSLPQSNLGEVALNEAFSAA
jgi:hypothetical protein